MGYLYYQLQHLDYPTLFGTIINNNNNNRNYNNNKDCKCLFLDNSDTESRDKKLDKGISEKRPDISVTVCVHAIASEHTSSTECSSRPLQPFISIRSVSVGTLHKKSDSAYTSLCNKPIMILQ